MSTSEAVDAGQVRRLAGRYRLTSMIGSGGIGTVWAAVDEVLGREVAVKDVVAPPWLSDQERELLRERTLREARAACRIDHPNVVMIYDVVEQDGRPWIIMQLVRARSLAQIIEEEGPRSPHQAAEIGRQVLSALQAAHAHGILHRDVKPSNVLVDDGRAVLADFGIATIEGEATLTGPDALVGAPSYIAPERLHGSPAGPASDLWSLGATLYTAVEGRPPYLRDGVMAILTAVATDEPDPIRRAGALAPLLDTLLRKDPTARPSVAEVERSLRRIVLLTSDLGADMATGPDMATGAVALEPTIEPTATQPVPHRAAAPPPDRRRRRIPLLAVAAGITVLAILLAGALVREASVPGFPARQPAGEPATTVPVTGVPAGSSAPGAGQAVPNGPSGSSTDQPAAEASQTAGPQPSSGPTGGGPTPTGTPAPTPTTTTTTTEPPTTTQEPPASTAATSVTA